MTVTETNNRAHVAEEIERLGPWFHNLHLPGGVQTAPDHPLGDFPAVKWKQIAPHVPEKLDGWRVLDIGCNAGFYTFQLASRGAHVTAVDIDPHYLDQARWAAGQFGLLDRVQFRLMSVYELARAGETYDLIWFLGVLYHLRHPLLALDILRNMTQRLMVLQTMTMPGNKVLTPPEKIGLDDRDILRREGWPLMAFIEGRLADDPTNWWAPNHAGVQAMVRAAGFDVLAHPAHEVYVCAPNHDESVYNKEQRNSELAAVLGRE